jgi:hypothetical protein
VDGPKACNRYRPDRQNGLGAIVSITEATQATWATPTTRDHKNTGDLTNYIKGRKDGKSRLDQLSTQAWTTWPTAAASDARMSGSMGYGGNQFMTLTDAANVATWPTPNARVTGGGEYTDPEKAQARIDSGRQINLSERVLVTVAATWPTPTTPNGGRTPKDGAMTTTGKTPDGKKRQVDVNWIAQQTAPSGQTPSGSQEPTAKRGALNPQFPCWLMGYPAAWDACAPTETPSSRRSRQKS